MPPEEAGRPSSPVASLLLVLVVVFINMAGFSLILPLLPFYGRELNATPVEITTLFAAYSFGNIFGEIWWGRMSDRRGRKYVLLLTVSGAALTYVGFAFANTLWLALLIRVVNGFFGGTLGVCQSYIADVTRPEERPRSMGYFGAALNMGIALGPAIGGLLAHPEIGLVGFRPPIFAAAGFSALSVLWTGFVLRETHVAGVARALPNWGQSFRFVASHALLVRLFALAFIGIGSFASMEAVFGLWTQLNFGWTTHEVGLTFIAVGSTGLICQLLLVGPLSHRYGEARVIVLGMLVLGVSMLLQPLIRQPIASVVLMSTLMAGHSIAFPNVGALISRSTAPQSQGSVLGLQMATTAFSRIVAPPIFGFVYSAAGPDAPYYACAGVMVVAVIIALQAVRIRAAALRNQQAATTV
jgi:MFS transporter, DHA1 family, tetracycline resistance protein